ncbi:MAG: ABC transporter permease [Bacteroidales bacterium]|nr:ABC transporter permease [Bacteroidales bacterium]
MVFRRKRKYREKIIKRSIWQQLPEESQNFFIETANILRFAGQFFVELVTPPYEHKEMIRQTYEIGYRTLALVSITGFILGLVLTLQSRPIMIAFGAESMLPSMVSISVIREVGPVITALICAGKIGSSIGAELGSMRVTEQIDAMDVSGTRPINYVVATRVIATTLMVPILVFYADALALLGSYVALNLNSEMTISLFLNKVLGSLGFMDVIPATIKTVFFGFAIGLIGTYKGYYSGRGTQGVGKAANTAVVTSSLIIFIIDLLAVQVSNLLMY